MIDINRACELAYDRRNEFGISAELGISSAYDRLYYWTITFAYTDREAQYTPLGAIDLMKPKFFCIDKNSGEFISGGVSFADADKAEGHEIPVPDEYYRVPWYE